LRCAFENMNVDLEFGSEAARLHWVILRSELLHHLRRLLPPHRSCIISSARFQHHIVAKSVRCRTDWHARSGLIDLASGEAARLAHDDLLREAVHREEQRIGRRLSRSEVDALELQTYEPIWSGASRRDCTEPRADGRHGRDGERMGAAPSLRGKRVLVVEDNHPIADALCDAWRWSSSARTRWNSR
jgi:hypothetical protein